MKMFGKFFKRTALFVSGLALGVGLTVGSGTIDAAGVIKFIVNGIDKTPANGQFNNAPATIMQNGTTYVPIRLVSNMLNVPIKWDGKNQSIIIGEEKNVHYFQI